MFMEPYLESIDKMDYQQSPALNVTNIMHITDATVMEVKCLRFSCYNMKADILKAPDKYWKGVEA